MRARHLHAETIATDPFVFEGVSLAELGYDPALLDQTYTECKSPETRQRLGIYVTQPKHENGERPNTTFIMQASHDYRLEPLWMRRMDILASRASARVIGVETPGTVGLLHTEDDGSWQVYNDTAKLDGVGQTGLQLLGAARGDFRRHADVQLQAMTDVAGLDASDRIILLGESMGATLAVDSLEAMKKQGLTVSDVILYEMVNTFKGYDIASPFRLMKVLPTTENDRRNQYFAENEAIGRPMVAFEMVSSEQKALDDARKSVGQQGIASALDGLGMARGKVAALKKGLEMYGKHVPKMTLVRGADSLATHRSDYENLVDVLRDMGADVTMHEVIDARGEQAIGHSHLVSLGRMALVSDWMQQRVVQKKS